MSSLYATDTRLRLQHLVMVLFMWRLVHTKAHESLEMYGSTKHDLW